MISKQDIMDFSREFGLVPNTIEKDYVLGWVLAGINNHSALKEIWVFKGGTCLKKCFFETYRFSEDLDFTLTDSRHLNEDFLKNAFIEIADWIYVNSGIELPVDMFRFDVYKNLRGKLSVQGRIGYRGPLQKRGDLPRIKLDLTDDELLALKPILREIHHPYPDCPEGGVHILCYCLEEIFAEKVRALAERARPRDLYDVIHLYRFENIQPDRKLILSTLERKCKFKGVTLPEMRVMESRPERAEIEAEWTNMLAHQLPALPPFEQFWQELSIFFEWLYGKMTKAAFHSFPMSANFDPSWIPPRMAQRWDAKIPVETIRYAAANHLCVELTYQGTRRIIEPYSLRRTKDGNILLHALRHREGEHRAYRIDRIEGAVVTNLPFTPKYAIELTFGNPISAPMNYHQSSPATKRKTFPSPSGSRKIDYGPRYVIQCPACGKKFTRKTNATNLREHKDRQGYPCYGKNGYSVNIK